MSSLKLEINLIPQTAWDNNLRSYLTSTQWDKVRRKCYNEANYTCEACGGQGGLGKKHPVECHERWDFTNGEVKLLGLIALCPPCHEVAHIGRAEAMGNFKRALNHFMKVNGINEVDAMHYIRDAARQWSQRNKQQWILNIDYLEVYMGEKLKGKKPNKTENDAGEAF